MCAYINGLFPSQVAGYFVGKGSTPLQQQVVISHRLFKSQRIAKECHIATILVLVQRIAKECRSTTLPLYLFYFNVSYSIFLCHILIYSKSHMLVA